jgi:hypothetical protein
MGLMRAFRRAGLVLWALALTGCTSWRPGYLDGGPIPHESRITLRDGSVIEIEDPRVEGDTLLVGRGRCPERVAILIRDIESLEFRTLDAAKTMTLVGVSIPGLLFAMLLLVQSGGYT